MNHREAKTAKTQPIINSMVNKKGLKLSVRTVIVSLASYVHLFNGKKPPQSLIVGGKKTTL